MAIRPKGPGKWLIDVYPPGLKGRRMRPTFDGTYEAACVFEQGLLRSAAPRADSPCPLIRALIPEYLAWVRLHRAASTAADVAKAFDRLGPVFGGYLFAGVPSEAVAAYQRQRTAHGQRPILRAVNKELDYFRGFLTWGVRVKQLERPRLTILPLPYRRPIPTIPHPAQIERLLHAIPTRWTWADHGRKQAAILCLWEMGLRRREALCLRWEDITWPSATVVVRHAKGHRDRPAALSPRLVRLLRRIWSRAGRPASGWIFANAATGTPWQDLRHVLAGASARAQIPRQRHHLLRHAFATDAHDANVDLLDIQKGLGHASPQQTAWYTRVSAARSRRTVDATAAYRAAQTNRARTRHRRSVEKGDSTMAAEGFEPPAE